MSKQAPGKFFADPDGKQGWREYRSVKEIPELENGAGEFAQLWIGGGDNILIETQEPSEDFEAYTDYCFNRTGRLVYLRFELRTAWGWGYREEGPVLDGVLQTRLSEFFSTNSGKSTTKPEMADDIPDALKPTLFLRTAALPFFKLLPKHPSN